MGTLDKIPKPERLRTCQKCMGATYPGSLDTERREFVGHLSLFVGFARSGIPHAVDLV
jgi:hypothetical protein